MKRRLRQLLAMTLAAVLGFGIHSPLLAEKKKKKRKKNADVENVGNREINKRSLNFYSIEREIALGKRLSMQIEQQVKLITDPEINEYGEPGRPEPGSQFRLQGAVHHQGGWIPTRSMLSLCPADSFYVNSGLITSAESESELAGVMAHEIAHVTARHGTENATKGQIANYAMLPLIFMGGALGYGLYQAAGFLIPLQFLHFSRKAETEADFLGLQYLYKTGYDPTSSVSFFEKIQALEKKKPGKLAKAFRTHPPDR